MIGTGWIPAAAVAVAAVAALTDVRTGTIPNRLTIGALALAPPAWLLADGLRGGGHSLFGALVCGLGPALLFARGAIGGGDVKLFAALGALLGASVGLDAELFAFALAALYVPARLAWRGRLFAVLAGVARAAVRRGPRPAELSDSLRLGPAVLGGVVTAIAMHALSAPR